MSEHEGPTAVFAFPSHGIMCFHCGEVFTTYGAARDHFGSTPNAEAGCLIDRVAVEKGGKPERGRGLLMALRRTETERDEWEARALASEAKEEELNGLRSGLLDSFGTTSLWELADRMSNEQFRAKHAVELLDAAGIPFDTILTSDGSEG